MKNRRVVVTGVGLISPIGNSITEVTRALRGAVSGVRALPAEALWDGVQTTLGAPAATWDVGSIDRRSLRTMGRVARMAAVATRDALAQAGLEPGVLRSGDVALAYGSTDGSCSSAETYYRRLYETDSFAGIRASAYLRFMSHTCAANLAQLYGFGGRVVPICSACTSASQCIGHGWELIAHGLEDIVVAGGAEELHPTVIGVFDQLLATSTSFAQRPEATPRPFDRARDGMVCGEGAGTLVLEELEHARSRGAQILGEVLGYGTSCDGGHLTSPDSGGIQRAMERGLSAAGVTASDIDYVYAHATGTAIGDATEAAAMREVYGGQVPVASPKGHTGHTLGACGALEVAFLLGMFQEGFLAPTRNLETPAEACAGLDHVTSVRESTPELVVKNNFAFGGINTSLVLRHPDAP